MHCVNHVKYRCGLGSLSLTGLLCALKLLGSVLSLLLLFSASLLSLGKSSLHPLQTIQQPSTYSNKTVFRLELLKSGLVVVDESESGALTSTKSSLEAKKDTVGGVSLVHLGKTLSKLRLGDVGSTVMDDINDLRKIRFVVHYDYHLPPLQKSVGLEFASSDGSFLGHGSVQGGRRRRSVKEKLLTEKKRPTFFCEKKSHRI